MDLMTNKFLNFPTITFDGKPVRNITGMNTLPDIPEKYFSNTHILSMKLEDNRLLESISFELYENTDYWDILMKLNDIKNMNVLPVSYDIVLDRAREQLAIWIKAGKLMVSSNLDDQYEIVDNILESKIKPTLVLEPNHPDEIVARKYFEILKDEEDKNEKYRYLKYLSPGDIIELYSDLLVLSQKPKMDLRLLTNPDEVEG